MPEPPVSDSEQELFGGRLRYDMGWSAHEYAGTDLTVRAALRSLPRLAGLIARMAWEADRTALITLLVAEAAQGLAQATNLYLYSVISRHLMYGGSAWQRVMSLLPALAVAATAAAVNSIGSARSTAATGRLEPKIERRATEQYLQAASAVELAAIEDPHTRRLIDVAEFGAGSARRMVGAFVAVLNSLVVLAAAGGTLVLLRPLLLPMLLVIAAPRAWGAMRVAQSRYVQMMQWMEHVRAGRVLGDLLTTGTAAAEVRVNSVGAYLLRHYRAMAETAESAQTRLAEEKAATQQLASALSGLATFAAYAALGGLVALRSLPLPAAVSAVFALRSGAGTLTSLVTAVNQAYEEALYINDLHRFLGEAERQAIPVGGRDLPERPKEIVCQEVSYGYPGKPRPALDAVTLRIPIGSVVALVGANGSGKSTLVKILAGLYQPHGGHVAWDEVDLAHADRRRLFERIALLNQDFERYPFTARTNITTGRPDQPVDPQRLAAAAACSGADRTIAGLPEGMDTLISRYFRGGVELSGGQWQALGHSRVDYRARFCRSGLTIADEPTSALDPHAEIRAFQAIRAMRTPDRAVVLVTHRMAAVRQADWIFVLHEGRLVEQGTHEELMARGTEHGRYAAMFQAQAAQYTATELSGEDPDPDLAVTDGAT